MTAVGVRLRRTTAPRAVRSSGLHLDEVSRYFGGNRAVDGFTMNFAPDRIYGLIGPNGSGKTTVTNLISRFLPLSSGEMHLDGVRISTLPRHRAAAMGIVRTFQMPKALATMSVRENLLVVGAADHRSESLSELRQRVESAVATAGLEHLADGPAAALSGGQTMLLQLARATLFDPVRVLLLDEPFAGVAPAIKERMIQAVERIRGATGCAVILVSHEMDTVRRLCDELCVMNAGRLLIAGTADVVMNDQQVIDAYLGRPG